MSEVIGAHGRKPPNRWLQLIFGILCMALVVNLQYAWTLFVGAIDAKNH